MTTPVSHGFPDFGRYLAQADTLVLQDIGNATSALVTYPIKFVGSYRTLFVWASTFGQAYRVELRWFGDAAGTDFRDETDLDLQTTDTAIQPIRILGPFLQVRVRPGPATPVTYTIRLWSAPDYGTPDGINQYQGGLALVGVAIGGGATFIVDSTIVLAGEVAWTGKVDSGNFAMYLQAVDYLGNVQFLDQLDNALPAFSPRKAYVPPGHLRVRVDNIAAGAATFWLYLTRLHP